MLRQLMQEWGASGLVLYTLRVKKPDTLLMSNFAIFKIHSPLDSAQTLLHNNHYVLHHTLKTLLQYSVKP